VLWGAGKKGKAIAKSLIENNLQFKWVCDNPKKIGKDIYGVKLIHYSELKTIKNYQSIITVANEEEQMSIKLFFTELNKKPAKDYYFFC
jgi:NADH/NAD ratio-sensing transcriptional regulator Rex